MFREVFGSLTLSQWVKAGLRLRKRQHQLSYFRQIVLDIVDQEGSEMCSQQALRLCWIPKRPRTDRDS